MPVGEYSTVCDDICVLWSPGNSDTGMMGALLHLGRTNSIYCFLIIGINQVKFCQKMVKL